MYVRQGESCTQTALPRNRMHRLALLRSRLRADGLKLSVAERLWVIYSCIGMGCVSTTSPRLWG
jgi:hypothetical protein